MEEKILVVAEKKTLAERLVIAASNSPSALMLHRLVRGFVHAGGRIGALLGRASAIWVLIVIPLLFVLYLVTFITSH